MKNWLINILTAIIFVLIGWFANVAWNLPKDISPVAEIKPHPLEKYTIENLTYAYSAITPADIDIGRELKKDAKFTSYEFTYSFDPTISNGPAKKVSGLINIPKGDGPFPLIIMFRGYVDQKMYVTGTGTQRAGEAFTSEGFITIAPDFLGYADSDSESSNIFESRFQTYTTAMTLMKSIKSVEKWDKKNVFIWAHSNGGQIALTALTATGANYPTVLWAPNSAKFPYSIIYYLDEAGDQGKLVITKLAEFMADYDVTKFAFNYYYDRIKAPVQLEQGTADDAVPVLWSDALSSNFKKNNMDIKYFKYQGADHNLQPSWNTAIQNDLKFFNDHIQKQ